MPVTNTFDGSNPTVGASANAWGGILNSGRTAIKTTLDAICTLLNAVEITANAALSRAGGTMTGEVVLADVNPTSTLAAGFRGVPVVPIDADRTFGLSDSGKLIRLFGTTNRTWTIPNGVAFPLGTAIVLRNSSTGTISIPRATGQELRIAGSNVEGNKSLASFGQATLILEGTNTWVLSGIGLS